MLVNKKLEVCVYIKPDNFPLMKCEGVALINSYCFLKNLAKMRGGFLFPPLSQHSSVLVCSEQKTLQSAHGHNVMIFFSLDQSSVFQ